MASDDAPPDGGYGWVCTVAAATINAHSWGFNSAYAVFLAYFLRTNHFPGASPMQYAFIGSLSLTALFCISPVATIAVRRIGIKPTMLVGMVLESTSLLCASVATKLWQLFLSQGILFGCGLGLLFIPTAAIVPQWFTTKRSLASGVALSGAGLGGAVYSLTASAMIENLGLVWAFRILAILSFTVNSSCILLIRDRGTASNQSSFRVSLLRRNRYLLLLGFSAFTMLGYFVLIFSLASYGLHIGLRQSEGALISALFNFGQAIGRPVIGHFSDRLGRVRTAAFTTLFAGILALAVWVNAKTYAVLIFFAVTEGLIAGNFWATIAPLMSEIAGPKNYSSGLNIMWFSMAIPATFSSPIALHIFSSTDSYLGSQLFTGFAYIAAALCLFALKFTKVETEEEEEM